MKTGIIVQARMGSSRLPGKVCREFHDGESILKILLKRLKQNSLGLPVILATSTAPGDDPVAQVGEEFGIAVFRGSEEDVLQRFIDAAEAHDLDGLVRVCADNPFLDLTSLELLVQSLEEAPAIAYHSYSLDGEKPTILSHIGVFAEATRLEVLQKVCQATAEPLYHEHVTNYLHQHPDRFELKLLPAPPFLYNRTDIRLTVDTEEDFHMHQKLYASCLRNGTLIPLQEIIHNIDCQPELLAQMKAEIEKNTK